MTGLQFILKKNCKDAVKLEFYDLKDGYQLSGLLSAVLQQEEHRA